MHVIRIVTPFSLWMLPCLCFGQNLVQNGDFENDFDGWTPVETASIATDIVHSGAKSMMASDTAKLRFSYVYREFSLDYDRHEISFWIYPASSTYFTAFELIANWRSGRAIFITRVLFDENQISFTAVDQAEIISNILTANSWNKVAIQVDKASLKQNFFINDSLVSSLTSSSFPTVEHLLVGDLSAASMFGTVYFDDIVISDSLTTHVAKPPTVPAVFELRQNYPNPFNPVTKISYTLSRASQVELVVFNLSGQPVKTLTRAFLPAGDQSVVWDGRDHRGQAVSSGVYFYRLTAGRVQKTKKMILMR